MQSTPSLDSGRPFDWGRTSSDYTSYRPGYPQSFFDILSVFGIGRLSQRVLDLATGPGVLAIPLAIAGATVTGVDIAENQILQARKLASTASVNVDFKVCDAHNTGFPSAFFDVITASMCMRYFRPDVILPEIRRMLAPLGKFIVASLIYLPRESPIATATEKLILKYNPQWDGANFDGVVLPEPQWSRDLFQLQTFHRYVAQVPFSAESWRGRIRACRGVGASMEPDTLAVFDSEHDTILRNIASDRFEIPHLVSIHVFTAL